MSSGAWTRRPPSAFFVRRLPDRRNYLLACGLDDVLSYFESLRLTREGLDYLASLGRFTERFLRWLEGFRFSGDVDAVPEGTPVFASGSLDEDAIAEIVAKGAPITGFGVGTSMGVSQDAPGLDIAYKLCAYGGRGRLKLSTGKPILPGRKQVFRVEENGRAVRDVIARAEETLPGRPLLRPVMRGGRRLPEGTVDLHAARKHAQEEVARLPEHIRAIRPAERRYPVEISETLRAYQDEVKREVGRGDRDTAPATPPEQARMSCLDPHQ